MISRRLVPAALILAVHAAPGEAAGQGYVSLDIGASRVTYDGYLTSNAASLAATYSLAGSRGRVLANGVITFFESGSRSNLMGVDALYRAFRRARTTVEARGSVGTSLYSFADPSLELIGGGRLSRAFREAGLWLGADGGLLLGRESEVLGVRRVDFGAWYRARGLTARGASSLTSMEGLQFGDLTGDVSLRGSRAEARASGGFRVSRDIGPMQSFAAGVVRLRLGSRVEVSASYGRALPGLLRFSPGARYASLGLRLGSYPLAPRREATGTPPFIDAAVALLGTLRTADTVVLLLRTRSAREVELSADFTDWEPRTLTRDADGLWRATFVLPSGVYRFNVRLDGGGWLVPAGAGKVTDDFGGEVGILVVR